jgi:hypothetical protein
MKPYGQKPKKHRGPKPHSADKCYICGNLSWKINKKLERTRRQNNETKE